MRYKENIERLINNKEIDYLSALRFLTEYQKRGDSSMAEHYHYKLIHLREFLQDLYSVMICVEEKNEL